MIHYELDEPNTNYFFLNGANLEKWERTELIQFLKATIDVFAWTPYEMPGIDLNFIIHELNVLPDARPVKRGRRSTTEHLDAVIEEVKKLEVSAITLVLYSSWLSNTVMVNKKTGKWRVCVDFTFLN